MRRLFLKQLLALVALSQDDQQTSTATKKKNYHVTLWSGGVAVKEWDTAGTSGDGGTLYFKDYEGKDMQASGTFSVEEQDS